MATTRSLSSGLRMLAGLAVLTFAASSAADEIDSALGQLRQVDARGVGHRSATEAAARLRSASPDDLLRILKALDGANPLAANWLRGIFEATADRALRNSHPLPVEQLEAFVRDRNHSPRARRLAYEWLAKADPAAPDRIIPEMLDDPSPEFRRDAVARLIEQAQQLDETGQSEQALALYRRALTGASDGDQVTLLAETIARLDAPVDLVRHFGLITAWHVIGPFDNHDGVGFAAVYPPEREIDFDAEYEGSLGPAKWQHLEAPAHPEVINIDEVGRFDLAKLLAPHKGAVCYAVVDFASERDQPVEFRVATPNAWKLWVNDEYLFGQEEYHRGMMFDQYVVRGRLHADRNRILLKICQDEQPYDWAQTWAFQFRVCDSNGKGLLSADRHTAAARPESATD